MGTWDPAPSLAAVVGSLGLGWTGNPAHLIEVEALGSPGLPSGAVVLLGSPPE